MKKSIRWFGIIVATPIVVFVLLCVLVYLPPVQNFLVKKATEYASEKTGMQIHIERVSLAFPLDLAVHRTTIVDGQDTLLNVEKLIADVQLLPLLDQKVEIDGIELVNGKMNSSTLIEGVKVKGDIGRIFLNSHHISLLHKTVNINRANLDNSRLSIVYADTTAKDTTEKEPVKWKIRLGELTLKKVDIRFDMPLDSMRVHAAIGKSSLKNGRFDLEKSIYTIGTFRLDESRIAYDNPHVPRAKQGIDPSHIGVNDLHVKTDSVYYSPDLLKVKIASLQLKEKSGLQVVSSNGTFQMDKKTMRIPGIEIRTDDSFIALSGNVGMDIAQPDNDAPIRTRLIADIGKGDMMRLLPGLTDELKRAYPNLPLRVHTAIEGSMKHLRLSALNLTLPGAFRLSADGELVNGMDSLRRRAQLKVVADVQDLSFVRTLTGGAVLPSGMHLDLFAGMKGKAATTEGKIEKGGGKMEWQAAYDTGTETYQAKLSTNRLNIDDFLPGDSLYHLTSDLSINGKGTDLFSPQAQMQVDGGVSYFRYARYDLNNLLLKGKLANGQFDGQLDVNDDMVSLTSQLTAQLRRNAVSANCDMEVYKADLQALRLTESPLRTAERLNFSLQTDLKNSHRMRGKVSQIRIITPERTYRTKDLNLGVSTANDSLRSFVNAGDLTFFFRAKGSTELLTRQMSRLTAELNRQWKARFLDQAKLRTLLPTAECRIVSGRDNPLANFLATKSVFYDRIHVDMHANATEGLNGEAYLSGLHTDSLWLDSIYFNAHQTPERISLAGGVKTARHKQQEAYEVKMNGEIAAREGNMMFEYLNGKQERGAYIGIKALLHDEGVSLHITPDNPTLVYRTFKVNPDNYIYIGKSGRIEAQLQMQDEQYSGLEFYSTPDSTVQQDLTVALHRIDIGEFRRIIPYMPEVTGLINAEAHYILSGKQTQVSTDVSIDRFSYNKQELGNWAMSAVYLPKETGEHRIDGFVSMNDRKIADVNGSYFAALPGKKQGALSADMSLFSFPVETFNSFVPQRMVVMSGNLNGTMTVVGTPDKLLMNGEVGLDSVNMRIPAASMNLRFDNRPVTVTDSKIDFDQYKIYTVNDNPFVIDGSLDFQNMQSPRMNLRMFAQDFELINSRKTRESLVYGKLFVDFNSTLKGTLNDLSLKGNMSVLGNSDFTYIMKDSPLTIEDRLGETVTFVNFKDTTQRQHKPEETLPLGTMNVLMAMHIDEAVQCRVDMTPNGSNYMLLEGGGDLSFQYKGDGSMFLNGRYSLISGEMKYEMPVIPLKTFHIQNGSYIEWVGNPMNPRLNIKASERVRATVTESEKNSRIVNFDVGVNITNQLDNLGFTFTLDSPDDGSIQNELASKTAEERNKLAVTMLVTGMYMTENNVSTKALNANTALNAFVQSEINNIAGSALRSVDVNFGMETTDVNGDGSTQTNYNFQFAKRFWNNRIRVVIGGKISTGNKVQQDQTFIDNISIEYRLDNSGTRYVKLFHNKNFESVLDGEVIETGVGLVLQKKVSRLKDLFIFRSKKKKFIVTDDEK